MISTRKRKQQNRKLLSHSDESDQNFVIANSTRIEKLDSELRSGQPNQELAADNDGKTALTNQNMVYIQTLKRGSLLGLPEK